MDRVFLTCPDGAPGGFVQFDRPRRRSMGFLEGDDATTWSCFLVTYAAGEGRWQGYFAFRPTDGDADDEVRTADIFLEDSEGQIDRKARGLGRPLLSALLASALHQRERTNGEPAELRKWFRSVLRSNSRELAGEWEDDGSTAEERTLGELRSIYASYRIDQVTHFITLVKPDDFRGAVDRILEGKPFDFGARDQLQFAMMVVEFIERRLPLPPFEVWVRDYLDHPEAYRLYTHTLHRSGRLP